METIEYKGYKIKVMQDEGPENPFETWDCEPALITFYGGRHNNFKTYLNAPSDLIEILALLPAETWQRGKRVDFYKKFLSEKVSMKELAEETVRHGDARHAMVEIMTDVYGNIPTGWRAAIEWYELAESLLKYAGIECVNTQSNGYSQGDCTLVLAIALPEWLEKTGVKPENAKQQLDNAVDLYSAWAWGDVYGISEITDTQSNDIEDGSTWDYYGSDHEKSGLLERAREAIDWHIESQSKEASNLEAALCSLE